jgi:hypothetical protein
MKLTGATAPVLVNRVAATLPQAAAPGAAPEWTNPAAAAALRSSVELLRQIEDGMIKNYGDVDKVRSFAADLRMASETFSVANDALLNDAAKENDAFLPLINRAGSNVSAAEVKLSSKEFASQWPFERGDIVNSIRHAKVISGNIADQLDPRKQ